MTALEKLIHTASNDHRMTYRALAGEAQRELANVQQKALDFDVLRAWQREFGALEGTLVFERWKKQRPSIWGKLIASKLPKGAKIIEAPVM